MIMALQNAIAMMAPLTSAIPIVSSFAPELVTTILITKVAQMQKDRRGANAPMAMSTVLILPLSAFACGGNCNDTGEDGCTTADVTAKCKCADDYELRDGENFVCIETCTDVTCDGHGTCDNDNGTAKCNCDDGYINDTDVKAYVDACDGKCNDTGEDGCTTADSTTQCKCTDGYELKDGDNFVCVDACDGNCNDTGEDGCTTADSTTKCKCANDYELKDGDNFVCIETCNGVICDGHGTCDNDNGTAKCNCDDGYINDTDVKACVDACSGNCNDTGEAGCTTADLTTKCKCTNGYELKDGDNFVCANACGGSCTKEEGDDTKDNYTGDCTTFGGVASCVCTKGNKHNAEHPLTCEAGDPCDDVECSTDPGYVGFDPKYEGDVCEQDRGFAKCKCDEPTYINGTTDLTTCTLDCSACTDPNGARGCSLDDDVFTCHCKTGYKNGTDPLTCVEVTTSSSTGTTSGSVTTTSAAFAIRHGCTAFALVYSLLYLAIME